MRAPAMMVLVFLASTSCHRGDQGTGARRPSESAGAGRVVPPGFWPIDIPRGRTLRPGEFAWSGDREPPGAVLIVVSLPQQMAYVYQGGSEIGHARVETGDPGRRTPTGIFQLLADRRAGASAAAPFEGGVSVALTVFGRSDSTATGRVRLPDRFAALVHERTASFGGLIVVVDDEHAAANVPEPDLSAPQPDRDSADPVPAAPWWLRPERSETGPLAIVVSSASREARVLRNGIEIGSAPIQLIGAGPLTRAAYIRTERLIDGGRDSGNGPRRWTVVGRRGLDFTAALELRSRVRIPPHFGQRIFRLVQDGAVIVLTPEELPAWRREPRRFTILGSSPRLRSTPGPEQAPPRGPPHD